MSREKVPLHGYLSFHDNAYLKEWTGKPLNINYMSLTISDENRTCTLYDFRDFHGQKIQYPDPVKNWKI